MDDILNAMLGGSSQQDGGNGDALAELLGGILGGAQPGQSGGAAQADPLAEILGSVMGGSQNAQGTGSMMDLIGAILGGGKPTGGQSSGGAMQAANPLAQILADKLGIPPELAQMVVTFFLAKILDGFLNKQQPSQSGEITTGPDMQSLDLDDLLQFAGDDRALRTRFASSGMTKELAQYANIDGATAERSLNALVGIVGSEREAQTLQPAQPANSDLKNLLDTWD